MKQAKTTRMLAARWLVVLAVGFVMLSGNVLASRPVPPMRTCSAFCAAHCPCCLSKAPAPSPHVPLAPASSSRLIIEKNFQFAPLLTLLLAPASETAAETARDSVVVFPAAVRRSTSATASISSDSFFITRQECAHAARCSRSVRLVCGYEKLLSRFNIIGLWNCSIVCSGKVCRHQRGRHLAGVG